MTWVKLALFTTAPFSCHPVSYVVRANRLLHSPSSVAVGRSVGYGTWTQIDFVIDCPRYGLGDP